MAAKKTRGRKKAGSKKGGAKVTKAADGSVTIQLSPRKRSGGNGGSSGGSLTMEQKRARQRRLKRGR